MSKYSPEFEAELRKRVLKALDPIKGFSRETFDSTLRLPEVRSEAGRKLPPHYMLYFALHDLLGFLDLGRIEKVAWTIPIEFVSKLYTVEHRKFGVGIFIGNESEETNAREILKRIQKAIKIARPYFKWLAEKAVARSELNINNRSRELSDRFEYLLGLYRTEMSIATDLERQSAEGTRMLPSRECMVHRRQSRWLGISLIDAFFSWTEHLFVHISVIAGRIWKGEEVANLISADWSEKYKRAVPLKSPDAKHFYDELIVIRRRMRNFAAHGAFGKDGEAFKFHSNAGAVPVLMPHEKGKARFTLPNGWSLPGDSREEDFAAVKIATDFISFLREAELAPAFFHVHEANMPTVLTFAKNGQYASAMKSMDNMKAFVD